MDDPIFSKNWVIHWTTLTDLNLSLYFNGSLLILCGPVTVDSPVCPSVWYNRTSELHLLYRKGKRNADRVSVQDVRNGLEAHVT